MQSLNGMDGGAPSLDEAGLRALFEKALDAVLVTDGGGRYVDANPAGCSLLGRSHGEVLELCVADVIVSHGPESSARLYQEFLEHGYQVGEVTLQRKDGSRVVAEYRASADIQPGLSVSVLRDVTERRQREELIRSLSAPILTIRDGLLLMPVVGDVDELRAEVLTDTLLATVRTRRAQALVLDLTGLARFDRSVSQSLLEMIQATRLLGTKVVVTGVSPSMAEALVGLGVDLAGLRFAGDLQGGIVVAEQIAGLPGK